MFESQPSIQSWKSTMKITGRRYDTGELVSVSMESGQISSIDISQSSADSAPWISPGFVDVQINGYGGQEFNDFELNEEKVAKVTLAQDACGVTSYCPTATTHSFEMLSHSLATIAQACESNPDVDRRVPGLHLEGPYLSPEDGPRGAHPLEHIRPPDWNEFQRLQEAALGRICILTVSPEYEGSAEFIAKAVDSGVLVAIGHTAADSDQIKAAVDAGASMSTHLGNGAHGQLRRHPNYIWDQLADDRLVASLIVDGHHLPQSVVQSFVRAKTPDRCVLVSDIMGMGGLPPGRYETSVGAIEILENGRLVVADQRQFLAGAGLPIAYGIANVMRFANVDLKTAIEMASVRPAGLLGHDDWKLQPGSPADLVLFDIPSNDADPLHIRATVKAGNAVFGSV